MTSDSDDPLDRKKVEWIARVVGRCLHDAADPPRQLGKSTSSNRETAVSEHFVPGRPPILRW